MVWTGSAVLGAVVPPVDLYSYFNKASDDGEITDPSAPQVTQDICKEPQDNVSQDVRGACEEAGFDIN